MATTIPTVRVITTEQGGKLVRCQAPGCLFSQVHPPYAADQIARDHQQSHINAEHYAEAD